MVTFLNTTIRKFNKLMIGFFIKTYKLKIVKNVKNINDSSIYIYKNSFVVNNKILNLQYNSNLDEDKYSLVYILYKNLHYNEKILNNKNKIRKCYLDLDSKNRIYDDYIKIRNKDNTKTEYTIGDVIINENIVISDDIVIIARKYLHKNKIDKDDNSLGKFCTYKVDKKNKNESKIKRIDKKVVTDKNFNLRRRFLLNLKMEFEDINLLCINDILKNSLFLDVEYINDIYDDFKTFPISKDLTLLCMIGFSYIDKQTGSLMYTNYTVDKLDKLNEYDILNRFLNTIIEKYNKLKRPIIIFHWSNADKVTIEKSLKRYPDLYNKYNNEIEIKYVDLLLIIKKTMYFESYSLKYVVKKLLNIVYETDCKNGFDAMCSIIENNCKLEKLNNKLKLTDFESTQDIIKYNKIDTELLYVLIKKVIT